MFPLIRQNLVQLDMLDALLAQFDASFFNNKLPALGAASVGMHVRHILEFYLCLQEGIPEGGVNYDTRKRDVTIETDPEVARNKVAEIREFISACTGNVDLNLRSDETITASRGQLEIGSNLFRELLYTLEHTIHHMAIIRIALRLTGKEALADPSFGVAPSTLKSGRLCAQ